MDELVVLAEIERSIALLTPTVYITPVWRYALWVRNYEQTLPFMAESDDYPSKKQKVTNVIIDQEEYLTTISIDDCLSREKSYWLDEADLYIHFQNQYPPFLFLSKNYGIVQGYSNNGVMQFDDFTYLPLLKDVPSISESADPFEYGRMCFNSASYTFDNSNRDFDGTDDVFGNEFNILVGKKGQAYEQYRKLIQYYISNVLIDLKQAIFEVKDKRERLSFKAPNTYYTKEAYPYIEDKYIDKVIQDAYGYCFGVPAVCIDEKDVYLSGHGEGDEIDSNDGMKLYRSFKFARKIIRLDKIESKMSNDTWVAHTPYKSVAGYPDGIDYANGIVFLDCFNVCPLKSNTAFFDPTRSVYDVRADGLFTSQDVPSSVMLENGTVVPINIPQNTPGAIIIDLLAYYANIPFHPDNYDIVEFNNELENLPQVGILLDKERDIYEIIENLQTGSLIGFQFMGKFNTFTARLDNPNRPQTANIKHIEILNLDEVTIDFNADLYASYTDISYGKTYSPDKDEDDYLHVIDKSNRRQMLDKHRLEKVYEVETLLPDKANAELKGKLILEDFAQLRPVINGIKLFGFDWFDLRVYDIIAIDFFIEGTAIDLAPRHIVRLMAHINNEKNRHEIDMFAGRRGMVVLQAPERRIYKRQREFVGTLRCKIMNREINPNTGVVTLNVRRQDASALWSSM